MLFLFFGRINNLNVFRIQPQIVKKKLGPYNEFELHNKHKVALVRIEMKNWDGD